MPRWCRWARPGGAREPRRFARGRPCGPQRRAEARRACDERTGWPWRSPCGRRWKGGPTYPPITLRNARADDTRPQRASAEASGAAWVGVLGFLGPALGPETPPQRRPADAQPTRRLREPAIRLSQRFVDGVALPLGQGPAVCV